MSDFHIFQFQIDTNKRKNITDGGIERYVLCPWVCNEIVIGGLLGLNIFIDSIAGKLSEILFTMEIWAIVS